MNLKQLSRCPWLDFGLRQPLVDQWRDRFVLRFAAHLKLDAEQAAVRCAESHPLLDTQLLHLVQVVAIEVTITAEKPSKLRHDLSLE